MLSSELKKKPAAYRLHRLLWRCAHVHAIVLLLFYVSIVHTDKNVHFEIAEPAV